LVVLQLKATDPNGADRSPEESAETAKKVADAIDVPLVLWGTANNAKDEAVLKQISEACEGKNVSLGPVEEGNHKGVGASALGYGQNIVASSPIDVNLAKQLNILLGNLGVNSDKILIDPTTGGLGYGLEYSYSVMERIVMAALTQEDDKLQIPMICNLGNEIWKCKEAKESIEEAPILGDPEKRGIMMEVGRGRLLFAGRRFGGGAASSGKCSFNQIFYRTAFKRRQRIRGSGPLQSAPPGRSGSSGGFSRTGTLILENRKRKRNRLPRQRQNQRLNPKQRRKKKNPKPHRLLKPKPSRNPKPK
jgi:hypothetical protein